MVAPAAADDLERMIVTHSLAPDTAKRVWRSLGQLTTFPSLGAALDDPWAGFRFVLGPWRWMVIVYSYDAATDQVNVPTIQDGRSSRAPRPL
jgi:hypothetical protein